MTHPEVRRHSRAGGYLAVLNEGVVALHLVELLTNRLDSTNRLGTSARSKDWEPHPGCLEAGGRISFKDPLSAESESDSVWILFATAAPCFRPRPTGEVEYGPISSENGVMFSNKHPSSCYRWRWLCYRSYKEFLTKLDLCVRRKQEG